jgi:SAF domain
VPQSAPDTTVAPGLPNGASVVASPPAARLPRPRWLDLRFVTGVLLVLGSLLLGTKIIADVDDTTQVLALARDVQPGVRLSAADVTARRVLLDRGLDHYLAADSAVAGYVTTRPMRAGELLPRSAIAPAADAAATGSIRWVTIAVPTEERPYGLSSSQLVDVWIAPAEGQGTGSAARLLASGVAVEAVANTSTGLSSAQESTVTLAIRPGSDRSLDDLVGELVAAARDARVYLTVTPGTAQ